MALTKKQRQQVWDKSGGFCWYCGCDLPAKGWHADHVEPIIRKIKWVRTPGHRNTHKPVTTGECYDPKNDVIENIVPTCSKCNNFKHCMSMELFRTELGRSIERARKTSVNFNNAERYGLIEITDKPIVFWFERSK